MFLTPIIQRLISAAKPHPSRSAPDGSTPLDSFLIGVTEIQAYGMNLLLPGNWKREWADSASGVVQYLNGDDQHLFVSLRWFQHPLSDIEQRGVVSRLARQNHRATTSATQDGERGIQTAGITVRSVPAGAESRFFAQTALAHVAHFHRASATTVVSVSIYSACTNRRDLLDRLLGAAFDCASFHQPKSSHLGPAAARDPTPAAGPFLPPVEPQWPHIP